MGTVPEIKGTVQDKVDKVPRILDSIFNKMRTMNKPLSKQMSESVSAVQKNKTLERSNTVW